MNHLRWLFLGDLGLHLDLQEERDRASASVVAARSARRRQDERIESLQRQILRLEAGFAAVVLLLRDKGIVEVPELERAVAAQVT